MMAGAANITATKAREGQSYKGLAKGHSYSQLQIIGWSNVQKMQVKIETTYHI